MGLTFAVSTAELIEQIKALPAAELEVIRNFIMNRDDASVAVADSVNYLNREKASEVGARIMEENQELFRRLAR